MFLSDLCYGVCRTINVKEKDICEAYGAVAESCLKKCLV